jgi:hypothetical protein
MAARKLQTMKPGDAMQSDYLEQGYVMMQNHKHQPDVCMARHMGLARIVYS